jgi:hypothetical protein
VTGTEHTLTPVPMQIQLKQEVSSVRNSSTMDDTDRAENCIAVCVG